MAQFSKVTQIVSPHSAPHLGGTGAAIGNLFILALALYSLPGLGNTASTPKVPAVAEKPRVLKVLRTLPRSGYSEGLDFHEGFLWNALPTELLKVDPKDGEVVARYKPSTEYSESLSWFQGQLWNVSFKDNGLYAGKLQGAQFAFKRVGSVPEINAWGLTHNGKQLIVTGNYSSKLYFLNPRDGKVQREILTDRKDLEDLAWDGVGLWTSSFTELQGQIFRIDPQTGKSTLPYSLPEPGFCPVIDGIALEGKTLWITGKYCTVFYQVELPVPPPANKR